MTDPIGSNPLTFDGKVVVVTGAGNGLGRIHALEFARRGARVVVNDLGGSVNGEGGSHTAAQLVVDEIIAADGEAIANFDSVATPHGAEAIVKTALDTWGRVDILVNNAGILRDASMKKMTPIEVTGVIDTHLLGTMYMTLAVWPHMQTQGYGRIINVTSAAGMYGNFGQFNYGAAKAGIMGATRVSAIEGRKYNILVNAIAPVAKTRMTEEILGDLADSLAPEFVTPVVVFLAHSENTCTGEIYACAGGHISRIFIGETEGWTHIAGITPESVRDHLDLIRDDSSYSEPKDLNEALGLLLKALEAGKLEWARSEAPLGTFANPPTDDLVDATVSTS